MSSNITHSPKSSKKAVSTVSHAWKPRSSKSQRPRKVLLSGSKAALHDGICGTSKPTSHHKHSIAVVGINPKIAGSSLIGEKLKVVNFQFSFPSSSTNPSTLRSEDCSSQQDSTLTRTPKLVSHKTGKGSTMLSTVSENKSHQRKQNIGGGIMRRPKMWTQKPKRPPVFQERQSQKDTLSTLPQLTQGKQEKPEKENAPKEGVPSSDYLTRFENESEISEPPMRKMPQRGGCLEGQLFQRPAPSPFQIRLRKLSKGTSFGSSMRDSTSSNSTQIPGALFPASLPPSQITHNPILNFLNEKRDFFAQQSRGRASNDANSLLVLPPINKSLDKLENANLSCQVSEVSISREGTAQKYQNQYQLSFKQKQEDGAVTTPKIVSIGATSLLNSIECNGGYNPHGQNKQALSRNQSTTSSMHTPKTTHHTPMRHGGGFGRHVSKAQKEANEILHKELANVINGSTPSSGIRIRALKSFYNSTGRVPRGREKCKEQSDKSLDLALHTQQNEEKSARQGAEQHHSRTQSRVPSSFYRSSPFSPIWKGDTNQTEVSADSNISRTLFPQKITLQSTDRSQQECQSSSARPSPSPYKLLYNDLPNLDLENIISHSPVTVENRIQLGGAQLKPDDLKAAYGVKQVKTEEQEKCEEGDSDTSEQMVEKMFIGQEFDADDDGITHSSMTKLRRQEEKEEIESIVLKPTEEVKIPLITTQDLCETPHPKDTTPHLEIKIPIPQFQSQTEEEEKKEEEEKDDRPGTPTAQTQPKVRKPRPCLSILSVTPLNLEQQYLKFQESGYKENPQFEYEYPGLAAKFLSQFKKPRTELLPMAKQILDNFLKDYGSESNYLEQHCGRVLTKTEVEQQFTKYIDDLGLQNHLSLVFCNNAVAPTSVVHDGKTGKSKICISMPIQYRQKRMIGVMHHEIGTHFLRKYNDKYQIWWGKRKQFEMKPCIATEEGLASINQLYEHALKGGPKPYLYRGALNYYACCKAAEMSFVELFEQLTKYVDDPFRRWKFCLRVKRGMTDTSQSGGMYKDQVYLEGSVKILRNRKQIDFQGLHCGKMTVDDSLRPFIKKKIKRENCKFNMLLRDMKKYMKAVEIIAKTNNVDMPLPPKEQ